MTTDTAAGGSGGQQPPSLGRRILLLLIPGIACIALGVGGLAVINAVQEETPEVTAGPQCQPSPTQRGPSIDLGVQAAGGRGEGEADGSSVVYPELGPDEVRALVRKAKQAGATIISTAASWRTLQPKPGDRNFDWSTLDMVIDEARAQGLQVRLQAATMPAWAFSDSSKKASTGSLDYWLPPTTQAERQRWAGFLTDLTRHVQGRVDFIEVWNEPNEPKFWTSGPDPEAFVRLLDVSYRAVKAVDASISVVSGGLSNNDIGFLESMYAARDAILEPSTPLFDQLGIHPFNGDRAPDTVRQEWIYDRPPFGAFDQNFVGFRTMREVMQEHDDNLQPLYIGEFGYSTQPWKDFEGVPDEQRADYLGEAFEAATCFGYISAMSWYYFHPTPFNEPSWTLLDRKGRPNETYQALVRWSERVGQLS